MCSQSICTYILYIHENASHDHSCDMLEGRRGPTGLEQRGLAVLKVLANQCMHLILHISQLYIFQPAGF